MRTFDLSPLYRSTVGFDRLFSMLDKTAGFEAAGGATYPPYNIERTGENSYRVTIAVAGFSESELAIEAKENSLTVKGEKKAREPDTGKTELLYHGIAARAFERVFRLADFVEVKAAKLEHGLLHIDLVREVPEAMKPRTIRINTTQNSKVIDAKAAAKSADNGHREDKAPRSSRGAFANHSSGATGTMVGGMVGSFAAGATSGRPGAAAFGSPPSRPSRACWAGWGGRAGSLLAALVRSAGRVRGSGGEGRIDTLLLTDPELFLPGHMFGMSPGGVGGRS
jgi:molecular chaperone IbpA